MERYRQQFLKPITMDEWLAKAHPDAPALPWHGDHGEEVCSFAVQRLSETGGVHVVLFDAHGREVARRRDVGAILATALALNPTPGELTFLPAAICELK